MKTENDEKKAKGKKIKTTIAVKRPKGWHDPITATNKVRRAATEVRRRGAKLRKAVSWARRNGVVVTTACTSCAGVRREVRIKRAGVLLRGAQSQ